MAIYTSSVGSGGASSDTTRHIREISDKIFKLGPNIAPLTVVSRKTSKQSVGSQEFEVLEDEPLPRIDLVDGAHTDVDTTVAIDNGTYFRANDLVLVPRTGERMLVSSINANTLTVVRGYGTTAGAALLDNEQVIIIGNGMAETSTPPGMRHTIVTARKNYTQFVSRTTGVTEIGQNIKKYGIDEKRRQMDHARFDVLRDIEYGFLFGEPLKDVEGATPKDGALVYTRFTTGGLKYWIDTSASGNVLDAGGVLTQKEFWDWVAPLYEKIPMDVTAGNKTLMLLCSRQAFSTINQWGLTPLQTEVGETKFGIRLKTYITPFGDLTLHQHYLLSGDEFGDYMFAVNPDFIGYRYLQNMDIKVKLDIQANDSHEEKNEIYGVCGFWLTMPQLHGYAKNVQLAG